MRDPETIIAIPWSLSSPTDIWGTNMQRCVNKNIPEIRAEINEIKTKNTIQRINETKSWFFEKINKID
jgi:hypothetical protein